jgi:putative tricarboxylic transport membrane protein
VAALIEKPRDVISGVVVIAIGAGFLLFGRELGMGTSIRMGPGYFPTILSILMIALGAVITVLALRKPAREIGAGILPWRGIILVIGATLLFGITLRGIGLAPAVVIIVLATAWASRYASLRASVPLSIGLAVFCALLFIRGLGLPLPLFGPWLTPAYWSATTSAPPAAPAPASGPPAAQ